MSIWDYFNGNATPEQNAGLLGFSSAFNGALGDGSRPVNFGQALAAGAQGVQQGREGYGNREREKRMLELQAQLMGYKVKDAESDLANQQAARERAAGLQQFYQQDAQGTAPAGAAIPQGGGAAPAAGGGGAAGTTAIYQQRLAQAQRLRAAGYAQEADAAEAQALKFQPKVKDIKEVQIGGSTKYVPIYEDGAPGEPLPYEAAVKLVFQNTGGKTLGLNPFTGGQVASLTNTQSPESIASNQVAWANNAATLRGQNMADARQRDALAAQLSKDKAPTEFQGKSAAFGLRATEANKTLEGLEGKGVRDTGVLKSVAQGAFEVLPLVGDKLGAAVGSGFNALPGVLGGPNEQQQQTEQARRDFVNAVLRQESGAAIGASEFENAAKQYFPQPGDTSAVVAQKTRNRRLAIQGLQANAGRAALTAPDAAPAAGGWSIKKVGQ